MPARRTSPGCCRNGHDLPLRAGHGLCAAFPGRWLHTVFPCRLFHAYPGTGYRIATLLYLLAHAIDRGRLMSSANTAGMAYSINTLVTKVSMGVTGFLLASFLSYGHYTGGADTVSVGLKHWVTAGFVWLPLGSSALQLVFLALWPRGITPLPETA
ncbi:MFS transporter [Komagataeibacter rhaeticus]|nr:MFS transporter [Komagataeibacter rhaeticus]